MFRLREAPAAAAALETWMVDHDGRGLAGTARELAYLDAQGGRPQGFAGAPTDRNARAVRATVGAVTRHFLLGGFFLFAGLMHFLKPKPYVAIVPGRAPAQARDRVRERRRRDRRRGGRAVGAHAPRRGLVADRHAAWRSSPPT